MPNAAIVAAALTNHAARSFGLYVDGVDVIAEPASPIRYATPLDSIIIEEQGPDAVSSMEFVIECSTALPISVAEGARVVFELLNATPSYTIFSGFVDHVDIENMDGNVGTRFVVRCTGIEALLDWAVLPNDVTIAAGGSLDAAVLALAGQAYGPALGYLRAFSSATGSTNAGPVAANFGGTTVNAVTITAGTTLREGIREVIAQISTGVSPLGTLCTVDFSGGLRFYDGDVTEPTPVTLAIDDNPPLAGIVAESLSYGIDASQYRVVVVKGTGVTVTVGDGSGKAGPVAVLTDSTITTVAAATAAGNAYLAQYASDARGSFDLSDSSEWVSSGRHVFYVRVNIDDARVGLVAGTGGQPFRTSTVAYAFTRGGARTNLKISFGGKAPSVTALTRQLTRTTLS